MKHIFDNSVVNTKMLKLFIRFLLSEGLYPHYCTYITRLKEEYQKRLNEKAFFNRYKNPRNLIRGAFDISMGIGIIERKWFNIVDSFYEKQAKVMWDSLGSYFQKFYCTKLIYDKQNQLEEIRVSRLEYGNDDSILFNFEGYDPIVLPLRRVITNYYVSLKKI